MELTFTRNGNTLTFEGTRNERWHDKYDWEKGTKFMKGMITGDEMQAFPGSKPFKCLAHGKGPSLVTFPLGLTENWGL